MLFASLLIAKTTPDAVEAQDPRPPQRGIPFLILIL